MFVVLSEFRTKAPRTKSPRTEAPWTKAPWLLSMGLLSMGLLSAPRSILRVSRYTEAFSLRELTHAWFFLRMTRYLYISVNCLMLGYFLWMTLYLWLSLPVRSTFAVRETASLGIMGEPRVPPLNPSESIVLSEHYTSARIRV